MQKRFTKNTLRFLFFCILVVSIPFACFASLTKAIGTSGFGGKILSVKIANVTCTGSGTGPIMLTSNIEGATKVVTSEMNSSTGQKVAGGVGGIHKMIPFYATDPTKKPKQGGWILGTADIVPNTSICKLKIGKTSIPFPVRKTSNYETSGGTEQKTTTTSSNTTGGTYNYE